MELDERSLMSEITNLRLSTLQTLHTTSPLDACLLHCREYRCSLQLSPIKMMINKVQFLLPCCHLLFHGVVNRTACLEGLTPFLVWIPVCSRTFAFLAEFFVIWVVLLLRASSQLLWGTCDLILHALVFPHMYWLNCSRLNRTAKGSFSIWAYLDSASVKDLEA